MSGRLFGLTPVLVSLLVVASAQQSAFAEPLFSPGQRVILSACWRPPEGMNYFCNNGLTRGSGSWYVRFPTTSDEVSQELLPLEGPPPVGPHAAAKADMATGELKTSIVGKDPFADLSSAVAEASLFDRISLQRDGASSGADQASSAQVKFVIDGRANFAFGSAVMASFSIKDGSQPPDRENPDAPVGYLLSYSARWVPGGLTAGVINTDLVHEIFSVVDPDNNGSFGVEVSLPLNDLLEKPLEFSLSLYTYGTGDAVLDFWNTAKLSLTLPEGYSFTAENGLLSARSGGPDGGAVGVPEPTSLALVLSGLLAFGMYRRAYH